MESGLCKHCFTGQHRPGKPLCKTHGPLVVLVRPSHHRDKETGIRDSIHFRENPFRDETLAGPPLITPTNSSQGCCSSPDSEASRDSRTTLPTGKPVRRATRRSCSKSSGGRRTVSVLLINCNCNTISAEVFVARVRSCWAQESKTSVAETLPRSAASGPSGPRSSSFPPSSRPAPVPWQFHGSKLSLR